MWTTFSPDQVDLNFRNERVLLRVVEILLDYVRRGADIIRLDAVTYIWRELGTRCAHLLQTHALVQLFRAVLDVVAPQVALITETNVPHEDNVGYFGDGADEAQMVYNFALPPLVLHTFHTGAASGCAPGRPRCGALGDRDLLQLPRLARRHRAARARAASWPRARSTRWSTARREHGGLVSYRADGDGGQSPYELNITWYSALNREDAGEPQSLQVDRFLASRAIALALAACPASTCRASSARRTTPRPCCAARATAASTARPSTRRRCSTRSATAARGCTRWPCGSGGWCGGASRRPPSTRTRPSACWTRATRVFAVLRGGTGGVPPVLALTNVTAEPQEAVFVLEHLGTSAAAWLDRITGRERRAEHGLLRVALRPYEVAWLTPD